MRFIDPPQDTWQRRDDLSAVGAPAARTLLTLDQWRVCRASWPSDMPVGVIVPNDGDVEDLRADLPRLALLVLQFPKWTDGRAYSQARLLRTRLRFDGEVRAEGEVLVDMLPLLQRTGFDAVLLRADQQLASAHRSLRFFAAHYQGDVLEPRPAFAPARTALAAVAATTEH
jgi:uncharacterized protein (DUF934 family)